MKTLHRLNTYFADLEKVMEGKGSLTSQLERFADALSNNTVPQVMSDIWDGTPFPEDWIKLVGRKTGLMKNWVIALNQKTVYESKLPLGVFFEPETLLNTLRQKTCRELKKPLDDLEMQVTFGDQILGCPFYFKIGDMELEGGKIGRSGVLTNSSVPERESIECICIGFVEKASMVIGEKTMEMPVYLTADKEALLCRIRVPFEGERNDILLAGCCFYI